MIRFADLSHHQNAVDLAAYQAAGHDRVILKATEGTGFVDSTFAFRWRRAGELGLARVAYHYARAKFSGADEFDHLWAVVQAAGGLTERDRVCLDVEDTDTPTRAAANASEFTGRAAGRGVTRGLVYTGRWYAQPNRVTASVFPAGWRQLWLSHYDQSVPDEQILLPAGWTRDQLVARQFTAAAPVVGVGGLCDYSRLLRDWLPSTPPVQEDDMFETTDRERMTRIEGGISALLTQFDAAKPNSLVDKLNRTGARLADVQTALLAGVQGEADRDARLYGRLDALDLDLSPEDTAQLAAALDLDEERVAAALQRRLAAALADEPVT